MNEDNVRELVAAEVHRLRLEFEQKSQDAFRQDVTLHRQFLEKIFNRASAGIAAIIVVGLAIGSFIFGNNLEQATAEFFLDTDLKNELTESIEDAKEDVRANVAAFGLAVDDAVKKARPDAIDRAIREIEVIVERRIAELETAATAQTERILGSLAGKRLDKLVEEKTNELREISAAELISRDLVAAQAKESVALSLTTGTTSVFSFKNVKGERNLASGQIERHLDLDNSKEWQVFASIQSYRHNIRFTDDVELDISIFPCKSVEGPAIVVEQADEDAVDLSVRWLAWEVTGGQVLPDCD